MHTPLFILNVAAYNTVRGILQISDNISAPEHLVKIENLSNHLGSCGFIVNVEDTSNILNCSEIYFQKTNSHSKFYYFIISWKLKQRKTYSIFKKQTQTSSVDKIA